MKLLNTIATTAVISLSLLASVPAEAFWGKKNTDKQHQNAKIFNPKKMIEEQLANTNRAYANFIGHYFRYSGSVKDIYGRTVVIRDNNVQLSNGKRYYFELKCETPIHYERDQQTKKQLLALDRGDFVTVSFEAKRIYAGDSYRGGSAEGSDCRIK